MTNNPAHHMRQLLDAVQQGTVQEQDLQEGPLWNQIKRGIGLAWGKKLQQLGFSGPPPSRQLVPWCIRQFETYMKSQRLTYANVTWPILINFLKKGRFELIDFGDGIHGRKLTADQIMELFSGDSLLTLKRIAQANGVDPILIPSSKSVVATKVANKTKIGGLDPTTSAKFAELICASVFEAALVAMWELGHEAPQAPQQTTQQPAAQQPAAAAAQPPAATQPAAQPAQASATPTPAQLNQLRQILGI
jgi:hypothetical protein